MSEKKTNENENEKKSGGLSKTAMIAIITALVLAVVVGVVFVVINMSKNGAKTDSETSGNEVITGSLPDKTDNSDGAEESGSKETGNTEDCLRIVAFADGSVTAGETATVTVKLENVTKLASLKLTAKWDNELTLVDAVYGGELKGLTYSPSMEENLDGWESVTSPFNFNWVAPDPADELTADCTYLTIRFKTAADKPGTYHLSLSANQNDVFDANYNDVPFTITDAEIVVAAKG